MATNFGELNKTQGISEAFKNNVRDIAFDPYTLYINPDNTAARHYAESSKPNWTGATEKDEARCRRLIAEFNSKAVTSLVKAEFDSMVQGVEIVSQDEVGGKEKFSTETTTNENTSKERTR